MQNNNSKYGTVPFELEVSPEIREFIENASISANSLMSNFEGDKLSRVSLAATLLWEYIIRTDWRYRDLLVAGEELSAAAGMEDQIIRTRQLQYVDRTEAFHRQIYGTLSVLILFLNHSGPRQIVTQLPISSVQRFLQYLQEQPDLESHSEHFDQLLFSVKYRASLIDHPQQSKLHHWMTMGMPTETVIIHYIPTYVESGDDEVAIGKPATIQYLNPHEPNFKPIVDCSSFVVSPEAFKTHSSLCTIIINVLDWCNGANDK